MASQLKDGLALKRNAIAQNYYSGWYISTLLIYPIRLLLNVQNIHSLRQEQAVNSEKVNLQISETESRQKKLEMEIAQLRSLMEELQKSASKYLNLYDFAPIGYITLDKTYVILNCNLTFAKMLGYEKQLIEGTRITRYVSLSSLRGFYRKISRAFETKPTEKICISVLKRIVSKIVREMIPYCALRPPISRVL